VVNEQRLCDVITVEIRWIALDELRGMGKKPVWPRTPQRCDGGDRARRGCARRSSDDASATPCLATQLPGCAGAVSIAVRCAVTGPGGRARAETASAMRSRQVNNGSLFKPRTSLPRSKHSAVSSSRAH
jgi:hypothetical protein